MGKGRRRGHRVHVAEEGEKLEQRVETEKDGAIPIEMGSSRESKKERARKRYKKDERQSEGKGDY